MSRTARTPSFAAACSGVRSSVGHTWCGEIASNGSRTDTRYGTCVAFGHASCTDDVRPPELEKYGSAGWIFRCVKPGLTGYWQIKGRQEVSYQSRIELDLFYVRNWSLMLDLRIILQTPLRVVRGAGAY